MSSIACVRQLRGPGVALFFLLLIIIIIILTVVIIIICFVRWQRTTCFLPYGLLEPQSTHRHRILPRVAVKFGGQFEGPAACLELVHPLLRLKPKSGGCCMWNRLTLGFQRPLKEWSRSLDCFLPKDRFLRLALNIPKISQKSGFLLPNNCLGSGH